MRSSALFPIFTFALSLAPFLTYCQSNQCTGTSCDSYVADDSASIRALTAKEKANYKRDAIAYENGANTQGDYYNENDGSYNAGRGYQNQPQDGVYGPTQPQVQQPQPQPQQEPQQQQQQQQQETTIPGFSGGGSGPLQCQPIQRTDRCQFGSYSVVSGDSCSAIGRQYSVPYLEIVRINNLRPDCQDLQPNSIICLPAQCALYTVERSDTCSGIAEAYNIAIEDFRLYNPTINNACSNLPLYADICTTPPGYR